MRTRLRVGAAWCAVIMLAGAGWSGCGGGGSRLSAPQYARVASSICSAADRAIARIEMPSLDQAGSASRAIRRIVVIQRDSVAGLRGLKPPERLGSLSQRWIALLDQGTDELQLMSDSLGSSKAQRAKDYAGKATFLFERAHVLVATHGVTSCRGPALEPR